MQYILYVHVFIFVRGVAFCYLFSFIFIPQSLSGTVWEIVSTSLALASVLTVSIQAAFFTSFDDESIILWIVNYTLDIFFLCDMSVIHTCTCVQYYVYNGCCIYE